MAHIQIGLLLAAVFASGFNGLRILPYATWGDMLLVIVGATWIVGLPLRTHKRLPSYVTLSFALFLISYMVEALHTGGPELNDNFYEFVKILISFYLLTYLIFDVVKSERTIKAIMSAFVASAFVNAIAGITDLIGLTHFGAWLNVQLIGPYEYVGRAYGLTMHPNFLGEYCAMALFLLIGLGKKGVRALQVTVAVILVLGVMASGSRAALIAILLLSAVLGFFYIRSIPKKTMLVAIALVTGIVIGGATMNLGQQIAIAWYRLTEAGVGEQESNQGRLDMYRDAWSDFGDHFVAGAGYANIGGAHNIYLQVLQSGGLIGMLGFLIYFSMPLWQSRNRLARRRLDTLSLGVSASVASFLVIGLAQNTIYARAALIPIGLLWALYGLNMKGLLRDGYSDRQLQMKSGYQGVTQEIDSP